MKNGFARTSLFVAAFLVGAVSARADVRVVAPTSAPFTTIQAAVNAAADGDVVLVRAGSYAGFTIANKALDVVGDVGAVVSITSPVQVQNVAVTRHVSLTNLRIVAGATGSALVLDANAGGVRVQDCRATGGTGSGACAAATEGGAGIAVSACDDVAIVRCVLQGGPGVGGCDGTTGGSGLRAQASKVALFDTTSHGDRGGLGCWQGCQSCGYGYGYGGIGGAGALLVTNSTLLASGSSLTGGSGGGNCHATDDGGWGGAGLWLFNSSARAVSCNLQGGPPAQNGFPSIPGAPIVGPGAQTSTLPARHMSATIPVRELQTMSLTLQGQPGDRVELVVAPRLRFLLMPAFQGVSLLRLARPQLVQQLGTIGAGGTLTTSWSIPDLGPGVQNQQWFLQAIFTSTSGEVSYGPPATQVLLDAAF